MKTTNVKNSDAERIAKTKAIMRAMEISIIGAGLESTIVGRQLDEDGEFTIYVTWISQSRMEDIQKACGRHKLLYCINPSTRQSARIKCPSIVGEGLILEVIFIAEYKM